MKVLAFVTQKGGTGKSTLSVMCAIAAHEAGNKVALIDMDKQGTITQWGQAREQDNPPVYSINEGELEKALPALEAGNYDYVIIDTAGVDNPAALAAMRAADMCLIPTRPAPQDLKALRPTVKAVVRLGKEFAFVLNQVGARLFQRYREAVHGLESIATVAQPLMVQRLDYQDAFGAGEGVTEFNPTGKAAEEARELWAWIEKQTEGKNSATSKAA